MTTTPQSVTCTERVRMNAIAGLLFLFAGDGIILYAVMRDVELSIGPLVSIIGGTIGIVLGLYYLLVFVNRRISVDSKSIIYTAWYGRSARYDWDKVTVSYHLGRNAYFIFMLAGKRVKFYGYDTNAQALFDFLEEHGLFDKDTMNMIETAREKEAERVRAMQKQAREERLDWGENAEDDDE